MIIEFTIHNRKYYKIIKICKIGSLLLSVKFYFEKVQCYVLALLVTGVKSILRLLQGSEVFNAAIWQTLKFDEQ